MTGISTTKFPAYERLAEAGEVSDRVRRAFGLAFGRPPDAAENQLCSALVREHGLGELCRVLCNSSELPYVD